MVIFESDDKDPRHRFCVDMQDIAGCRFIDPTAPPVMHVMRHPAPEPEEHKLTERERKLKDSFRMVLSFVPGFYNRFLFDEDSGTLPEEEFFGTDVVFTAEEAR
jgi:hypothetical protein